MTNGQFRFRLRLSVNLANLDPAFSRSIPEIIVNYYENLHLFFNISRLLFIIHACMQAKQNVHNL